MDTRISLHPATADDVDFIVDIDTNPALWLIEDEIEIDKNKVKNDIEERIGSDWYKYFIVRLNDTQQTPIGYVSIWHYIIRRKSWEIGYYISREYRKQGYCYEAVSALLKYAFEDYGAHRVVAMCSSRNEASWRIIEKAGMIREGVFREELPCNDKWVDQLFYAILDNEYKLANTHK